MTSRDCFYCGKRVAAGKSCSVLFLDGQGYPPSDSEIIQYAQLCDTTRQHDAGHAALLRVISVLSPVQRRQQFCREQRARHTHDWGSPFQRIARCSPRCREGTCEEAAPVFTLHGPRGGISNRKVMLARARRFALAWRTAPKQSSHEEQSSPPSLRPCWTPSPHTTEAILKPH